MPNNKTKLNRNYGYDILINTFESSLRRYLVNEVFLVSYGNGWKKYIPVGVINELSLTKDDLFSEDCSIDDFFEELTFLNLKDIIVAFKNFKLAKSFFGELSKDKFIELMDKLNMYRRKIAHAKSVFNDLDLMQIIECVELLSQGESAKEVITYLQNQGYKNAKEVPLDFFEEYDCQNNLPPESYDLDGGFVGREKEIQALRKLIKSEQDRIITIAGAGGVGKTAIALRVTYTFLADPQNPYEALIWFSAKTSKLTDEGIVSIVPGIKSGEQLVEDLLSIVDPKSLKDFSNANVPFESYQTHLFNIFSSQKCLIIVDNLETILRDDALIYLIKDIPRPSQVLITSRKGLGEIERRYYIMDMPEKDAIKLFRTVSKERNRSDLLRLNEETISKLVKRVRCYPLLIKWSIGQVCLGRDIDAAFSEIFAGESEIAQFSFNDVFNLLSETSKTILFSMVVCGDKSVSRYVLMHLADLTDDQFEDAIKELVMTSFVFPETKETDSGTVTEYLMLTLTRGFIENKLDEYREHRDMLSTRYYHLSEQVEELEKAKTSYSQSLFSLGIKSIEEQVAFNYVKAAKNFSRNDDIENAEKNFEQALKVAPRFSYALMEYSKFEFVRDHRHDALKLAEKAVECNKESYHVWFHSGILLRKSGHLPDAIGCLKIAKQINPKHLPIYNELGRAYTIAGDCEKADAEFKEALKEEKHPNYRHKVMTLQFLADNYKRWGEAFALRRDWDGRIDKLKKGFGTIQKALDIAPKDKKLLKIYCDICKELGIALWKKEGTVKGKPYLDECLQSKRFDKTLFRPDKEMMAELYFYLAELSSSETDRDIKQIATYIEKGLANCMTGSKWFDNLNRIKRKILQKDTPGEIADDRKHGRIKFYNNFKYFGIIETVKETYLFFSSAFRQNLSSATMLKLDGLTVSFILIKNPRGRHRYIASDIVIDGE